MVHTAKQQGGECCSLILQVSDRYFTQSWLPVVSLDLQKVYLTSKTKHIIFAFISLVLCVLDTYQNKMNIDIC